MSVDEAASLHYFNLGGTIRSREAYKTISWVKPFLPTIGITRVANITGLDTIGIPTYLSIRPNAKHLSVSQGKGVTPELAQASALMEAIEVFHAENIQEPTIYGTYQELARSNNVIDPSIFAEGFLALSSAERSMGWLEATELCANKSCYVPYALATLNSSNLRPEHGIYMVSSNGLASGNCYMEALSHALFEVIERDALFRWGQKDFNAKKVTQINLDSITTPTLTWLISCYRKAGIYVMVWDITSECGVPTFHCLIQDSNELRGLGKFTGTGTHLVKEIALARALTEAAQSRLTLISGSRDDVFPERYIMRTMQEHLLGNEMKEQGSKDFAACYQPVYQNSFAANVTAIVSSLQTLNLNQVFAIDHTKSEFNIPVVQVLVPGLRFRNATM